MDHFYQGIHGWFYHEDVFRDLIRDMPQDALIVEVGSWKGKSAAFIGVEMQNAGKGALVCVDHWKGSDEKAHRQDEAVKAGTLFDEFLANVGDKLPDITALRMDSVEASKQFDDEDITIVYLDAAHDFESVIADLEAWWPKVERGGVMVMDDYTWPGVKEAAHSFFGKDKIEVVSGGQGLIIRKE